MEYKVLSGSFDAESLERDLNSHAAGGWRVVSAFQAISVRTWKFQRMIVLERTRA